MAKTSKNKELKSKSNYAVFLIYILIGGICGFFGGKLIAESMALSENPVMKLITIAELFIFVYLAAYVQIIIHEGGHLIFGRLSGYDFISFRIGNVMFLKENGHIKRKKFTIVGTGGQCLMMPPECDGYHYPYMLYNLGGPIGNIVFSMLCLVLYIVIPKILLLSTFLIISFIIGISFALINGIPMRVGGIANDGYNAMSLGKNEEASHALWLQLHINGLIARGMRLRDMPEEWFSLSENADLKNPLICGIGVYRCSYLEDKQEFEKAKSACKFMLENAPGVLEVHKNELRCELMFYEMIGECRKDEIDRLYTKKLRKYIKATSSYVSRKRLMYAHELLVNKNEVEAQKQLTIFEKVAETYPYQAEVESEREIIDFINNTINE